MGQHADYATDKLALSGFHRHVLIVYCYLLLIYFATVIPFVTSRSLMDWLISKFMLMIFAAVLTIVGFLIIVCVPSMRSNGVKFIALAILVMIAKGISSAAVYAGVGWLTFAVCIVFALVFLQLGSLFAYRIIDISRMYFFILIAELGWSMLGIVFFWYEHFLLEFIHSSVLLIFSAVYLITVLQMVHGKSVKCFCVDESMFAALNLCLGLVGLIFSLVDTVLCGKNLFN